MGTLCLYGHTDTLTQVWIVTVCSSFSWHFYLQIACCILFLHITSSPGLLKHRHFTWVLAFPVLCISLGWMRQLLVALHLLREARRDTNSFSSGLLELRPFRDKTKAPLCFSFWLVVPHCDGTCGIELSRGIKVLFVL